MIGTCAPVHDTKDKHSIQPTEICIDAWVGFVWYGRGHPSLLNVMRSVIILCYSLLDSDHDGP